MKAQLFVCCLLGNLPPRKLFRTSLMRKETTTFPCSVSYYGFHTTPSLSKASGGRVGKSSLVTYLGIYRVKC